MTWEGLNDSSMLMKSQVDSQKSVVHVAATSFSLGDLSVSAQKTNKLNTSMRVQNLTKGIGSVFVVCVAGDHGFCSWQNLQLKQLAACQCCEPAS